MELLIKFLVITTVALLEFASALGERSRRSNNLLINRVIEQSDSSQGWKRNARTGYWTVSEDHNLYEKINGEEICLCFKETKVDSYFSQFLTYDKHSPVQSKGLQVQANLQGSHTEGISIKLYIRYTNGVLFKVSIEFDDTNTIRSLIPKYGEIKTIAAFVVLEKSINDEICLCDINLQFSSIIEPGFSVYKNSYPIQRHVNSYFLTPNEDSNNIDSDITIATQLTVDRLNNLERLAQHWKGPVSASVLVMENKQGAVDKIVRYYLKSEVLSRYVTIHLVYEDSLNGNDGSLYPVNYLRNVALENVKTDHVFLLDADLVPGFNMSEAVGWMHEAGSQSCEKCAFVAPVYQVNHDFYDFPTNKSQMLDLLHQPESPITSFATASHGVVNFWKWERTSDSYEINYKQDMEPYFIIDSKAPLLNDVYSGYGRDKCAYSTDLNHAQYKFIVLPQAFLINVKHKPGGNQPRMYELSKGVQLTMFFSIDFHKWELNQDQMTFRTQEHRDDANTCKGHSDHHDEQNIDHGASGEHWTEENNQAHHTEETNLNSQDESNEDHPFSCQLLVPETITETDLPHLDGLEYESREDVIAERLIRQYQTGHVLITPSATGSGLLAYLHFVHPDSVTVITPREGPFHKVANGHRLELSGTGDMLTLLTHSREENPGPTLMFILTSNMDKSDILPHTAVAIQTMTKRDLLVISGEPQELLNVLKSSVFCNTTNLELFRLNSGILIKPKDLQSKDCPPVPKPPVVPDDCTSMTHLRTDVILMTRNRPLQTLAFLQSLSIMAPGVSKVWIQYRADDEVFKSGYENAINCVKHSFETELVSDKDGFGKTLMSILHNSSADFVILAVDEIVWLRPVDVNLAACLLHNHKDIVSFQLRLGENIGVHNIISSKGERIFPVGNGDDISLFYPLRMPYDFGYILNVDGTMMNISTLREDFSGWIEHTRHPGELESRWMVRKIHTRARQWHLMYKESRLVNNALNTDGRVIGKTTPVDGSYALANLMLNNKKQIAITDFISQNAMHSSTHINKDVVFEDIKCIT